MKELEERINRVKYKDQDPNHKDRYINYSRLLVDLISGLLVGSALGYIMDKYLNTLPMMLFICSILGISGGFYNFYKYVKNMEQKINQQEKIDA